MGEVGWKIGTWGEDSPAERMNRGVFRGLSLAGALLVSLGTSAAMSGTDDDAILGEADRVIWLARTSKVLGDDQASEDVMLARVGERTGSLSITGWKARRGADQNWVVSYTFMEEGIEHGVWLEVNAPTGLVRYLGADPSLKDRYEAGQEPRFASEQVAPDPTRWRHQLNAFMECQALGEASTYLRDKLMASEVEVVHIFPGIPIDERGAPLDEQGFALPMPMWSPAGTIVQVHILSAKGALHSTHLVDRGGRYLYTIEATTGRIFSSRPP